MKVLLAEDDRATRTRILTYLEEWGHEAAAVADGEEALARFREDEFDLVLSDWQMPKMNGVDLVRQIRKDRAEAPGYLYVILLTSRSEKRDVVEGIEAGADDFVTKPFDKDELRVRIQAGERIVALEAAVEARNRELEEVNRAITATNERMRESLLAAAEIQKSFLPEQLPQTERAAFAWRYITCDELAGDTMNIVRLDDHRIGIYVVDVSGHGVPAALLSVHLSRVLTRRVGPDAILFRDRGNGGSEIASPSEVAAQLNRKFGYDPETQQYFTFLYGILDLTGRDFRYISAGHPGPILVSKGTREIFPATPPAIGFLPDGEFTESTLRLVPGDRLLFYTDGVFEVTNLSGEELGEDRLADAFLAGAANSLNGNVDHVIQEARNWMGQGPFPDDISLVVAEIR